MGIKQWYSSQPVEIKVAIIGGLLALLGGIIGGVFTLTAAEVKANTPLPTSTATASAATTESPISSPARSRVVSVTAAPTHSSSSPTLTLTLTLTPTPTPPGPKSASGTYTFTRQVNTCTFTSCTTTPFVLTLTCPAPASCAASWSPWGSHPATFDGTTIKVSFSALGSVNCKGTALPTALTLDVTVLSWTAGQGGAVRTPTRMQGTITASAPASSLGCPAAGDVETITYG